MRHIDDILRNLLVLFVSVSVFLLLNFRIYLLIIDAIIRFLCCIVCVLRRRVYFTKDPDLEYLEVKDVVCVAHERLNH